MVVKLIGEGNAIGMRDLLRCQLYTKNLKITHHCPVQTNQQGQQIAFLRGRGVEFEEVRVYQPGDDIRHMDWRVTARRDEPHIKLYREEKERVVNIVVDYSPSMFFGTQQGFKSVVAAKIAAIIAWTAMKQGDRVGGFVFSGNDRRETKPRTRKHGLVHLLKLLADQPKPFGNNASDAMTEQLKHLKRSNRPGSLNFLISDFSHLNETVLHELLQIKKHHEVIAIFVFDKLEKDAPPGGIYNVTDGQKQLMLNTYNKKAQAEYRSYFEEKSELVANIMRKAHIPLLVISTEENIEDRIRKAFGRHG